LYIAPRGLITILLFFQIQGAYSEFAQPQFDQGILLVIILVTSIIMTIALVQNGITLRGLTLVPDMVHHHDAEADPLAVDDGTKGSRPEQSEPPADEAP
jgi:hypothetical protein